MRLTKLVPGERFGRSGWVKKLVDSKLLMIISTKSIFPNSVVFPNSIDGHLISSSSYYSVNYYRNMNQAII